MHAGFEAHHRGEDAETALVRAWQSVAGTTPPPGALQRAFEALRLYRMAHPHDRIDRPEVKFRLEIPRVSVPLIGYIDLIRGDDIHEFKTGGGKWTQEKVDGEIQATAYWLGYEKLIGLSPRAVVYHVIATQPMVREPFRLETVRTAQQGAEFLDLARRVYGEMRAFQLRRGCRNGRCRFPDQCQLYE